MSHSYTELSLYIDGSFIGSDERAGEPVFNPASGQILGQLPHATAEDLDTAIDAAERAFQSWRWTSPIERSQILRTVAKMIRERCEEIARCLTLDQGKPLVEARMEIMGAADHAEWHAEECRRIYGRVIPARDPNVRQTVVRQPVGVCASFSPWNYPLNQALRKICAALGSGCTIILKASEDAPSAVVALAQMFHEAGLPAGCLNIVWGVPAKVSEHLITSPIVRKISFTGSIPVGKHLAAMAGTHMKRVTMELGGHSPVLIFNDADIDEAATLLAGYKGLNAGQVCMSPSRFYVHEKVAEEFGDKFAKAFGARVVGNGMNSDTTMGPLAHERRVSAMTDFVSDATAKGASIVTTKAEGDRELQEAPVANQTVPAQAAGTSDQPAAPKTSAHEKAFDLFDVGKLSEKALLITVGAERSGFELAEDLRLRTLTAFEDGRLSEDAMIKLLS